jgi:Ca2+-binding RTX toxin-like protein
VKAGAIDLTLDGGEDNDFLIGGEGNDLLIGARGLDTELGGPGDDTFLWNPGDGNDVLEGQGGQDSMVFNGANIGEKIDISANGTRLRFSRDVANIVMDCNGIELIEFTARGGADTITINDLTGTDVTKINLDLAGVPNSGVGDNSADTVIVNATGGDDVVEIAGSPGGVSVSASPPLLASLALIPRWISSLLICAVAMT